MTFVCERSNGKSLRRNLAWSGGQGLMSHATPPRCRTSVRFWQDTNAALTLLIRFLPLLKASLQAVNGCCRVRSRRPELVRRLQQRELRAAEPLPEAPIEAD